MGFDFFLSFVFSEQASCFVVVQPESSEGSI
jgi:hypothetical protein